MIVMRVKVFGSLLAGIGCLLVLAGLALTVVTGIDLICDAYFPYEGTVLRIERRWYDRIPFEFNMWEHLIIQTPGGKIIDKYINQKFRIPQRIEIGDFVVKQKGFRNSVRPRDKKTTREIIDDWRKRSSPPGVC